MQERVRALNSELGIDSRPGSGTVDHVGAVERGPGAMRCTVLIGDDHQVVLEGLRRILDRAGFQIVGEVSDGRALVEAAERLRPDVVVADISMPLLNGVEAARQIRARNRRVKIVFFTMHPEPMYAIEAISAGGSGSGYVLKDSAGRELIAAIQEALRGRTYVTRSLAEPVMEALSSRRRRIGDEFRRLTPRQREVLQLLAEGRSDKQLAAVLRISVRTVEFHKSSIKQKLGVKSIAELARYAAKVGIVA